MLGGSGVHVGEQKEEEKEAQVRGEAPEDVRESIHHDDCYRPLLKWTYQQQLLRRHYTKYHHRPTICEPKSASP